MVCQWGSQWENCWKKAFINELTKHFQKDSDGKSAQTLWVDDQRAIKAIPSHEATDVLLPHSHYSPFTSYKKHSEGKVYEGVPNEWVPDVVPTETYVHHTLQRSLQLPQILSPVPNQLPAYFTSGVEGMWRMLESINSYGPSPYAQHSTQRRTSCRSVTPNTGGGTLTRYLTTPNGSSTLEGMLRAL
uniref:Uncharacterized protein n=1 Tax=Ditylenchus dipsaci TaxID=166011 RepID=A0A915CQ50_9BILA